MNEQFLDMMKSKEEECLNCEGENKKSGHVELLDGVCIDCGQKVTK